VAARTYAIIGAGALVAIVIIASVLSSATSTPERPQLPYPYWTEGRPMPTPRTEVTGAAIDNSVYIIGGFDGEGKAVTTVEVYDSLNDSWGKAAPLPQPLHHAAAASHDGRLYVAGGYFADNAPSGKLFVYSPARNEWKELAPMLTARGALTASFVNGTLYAVGGVNASFGSPSAPAATNEAYDPASDSWEQKEPMPTPRQHLASASFADRLYVIGGRIDSLTSNVNSNEMYDPAQDNWTKLSPMPSKRGGLAAGASSTDGRIYVFGGESLAGTFKNSERYRAGTWESAPDMPNGRHGLAAVSVGSKIFVVGGGPQPGLTTGDFNQILNTFYAMQ
jgi:N-acetylneuraminic acid mutarotase